MWELKTTGGTTLYLCLEDTLRRVQNRLLCITDEVPPNAFFATSAGTLSDGLCEQIRGFVKEHPEAPLPLSVFCVAVSKVGEPCKYKSTGNSFSFVARSVSRSEALSEY